MTTILVVDDDEDSLQALRLLLERENYRVILARSGAEALSQISSTAISLVMTDWFMSGMDGLTLCRTLRADPIHRGLPIVLMSSYEEPSEEALWNAFVRKPASWPFIARTVHSLVTMPRV